MASDAPRGTNAIFYSAALLLTAFRLRSPLCAVLIECTDLNPFDTHCDDTDLMSIYSYSAWGAIQAQCGHGFADVAAAGSRDYPHHNVYISVGCGIH